MYDTMTIMQASTDREKSPNLPNYFDILLWSRDQHETLHFSGLKPQRLDHELRRPRRSAAYAAIGAMILHIVPCSGVFMLHVFIAHPST